MSLTSLCLSNIADMVGQMPPLIQDMVIQESRDVIKAQVKDELEAEAKLSVRKDIQKEATNYLSDLIPEIMSDMISAITDGRAQMDYLQEYKHIPTFIVQCAIDTAERSVTVMEERYVHQSFEMANTRSRYDFDDY